MNDYPYDLGTYSRAITTDSADAQQWWDRGLNWLFGYNHEEAMVCFERALEADSNCAMAYWGLAYCLGPNYNKPWDLFEPEEELPDCLTRSREWLSKAADCAASDVERAVIDALWHRYPQIEGVNVETLYVWNGNVADAMREVHKAFPDDNEVTTIFVETMMNRTCLLYTSDAADE